MFHVREKCDECQVLSANLMARAQWLPEPQSLQRLFPHNMPVEAFLQYVTTKKTRVMPLCHVQFYESKKIPPTPFLFAKEQLFCDRPNNFQHHTRTGWWRPSQNWRFMATFQVRTSFPRTTSMGVTMLAHCACGFSDEDLVRIIQVDK